MTVLVLSAVLAGVTLPASALTALADPVPAPEDVGPGWVAAVVFVLLFVVTILLWMNMRKQLGRIRIPREDSEAGLDEGPEAGSHAGSDRAEATTPPADDQRNRSEKDGASQPPST